MNKKFIILIGCLVIFTGCGSNKANKNKLVEDSEILLKFIENDDYYSSYNVTYKPYAFENEHIYVYKYENGTNNIEIEELKEFYNNNIQQGLFIKNSENDIYMSVENKEFCAIKKFNDTDIKVYKISEQNKCHDTILKEDALRLRLMAYHEKDGSSYESNFEVNELDNTVKENVSIANDNIKLVLNVNVIDPIGCKYMWYRNGKIIKGANSDTYIVSDNNEDAYYHARVETLDGRSAESISIHVKIKK